MAHAVFTAWSLRQLDWFSPEMAMAPMGMEIRDANEKERERKDEVFTTMEELEGGFQEMLDATT